MYKNSWPFTVLFKIDDLPDFMYEDDFMEDIEHKVIFPYKSYRLIDSDFFPAQFGVREIELELRFESTGSLQELLRDFAGDKPFVFYTIICGERYKVRGEIIDVYYPDEFDETFTKDLFLD